jgi:hypothetical protein
MVGSYEAPEDGYLRQWMFRTSCPRSESDWARDNPVPGRRGMILRLRSEMKEGKVERALYGKMQPGCIPCCPRTSWAPGDLLPQRQPNDRNLEWT